jgi:uncharacterized protein (DUF427 family)
MAVLHTEVAAIATEFIAACACAASATARFYYKRISMKATWNGVVVAESDDTVLMEGNHYFPESALKREFVHLQQPQDHVPWKGQATYLSLLVHGELNPEAAWTYADPKPEAEEIRGRMAFWKGVKVTVTPDGAPTQPPRVIPARTGQSCG